MGSGPSSESWITCPQCHRPMPPGGELCAECLVTFNLEEGIRLAKAGDFPQAMEKFKRVCSVEGFEEAKAQVYYYSGLIYIRKEMPDKAEAAWRKCLGLNPAHVKAKSKLVGLIVEKPKREWSELDRKMVEGSEFEKAPVVRRSSAGSDRWVRWGIAAAVLLLIVGAGAWGVNRAVKYFTFDRHIEQVERLASTHQIGRSMQYFNDQFGSGQAAHQKEQAQTTLAPIFKQLGLQRKAEGQYKEARQLLKIASGFNPEDHEVRSELLRLREISEPQDVPLP